MDLCPLGQFSLQYTNQPNNKISAFSCRASYTRASIKTLKIPHSCTQVITGRVVFNVIFWSVLAYYNHGYVMDLAPICPYIMGQKEKVQNVQCHILNQYRWTVQNLICYDTVCKFKKFQPNNLEKKKLNHQSFSRYSSIWNFSIHVLGVVLSIIIIIFTYDNSYHNSLTPSLPPLMIGIIIFGASNIDGFSFAIEGYDIYHHLPTPSLPLMIEIIISVNVDNDRRPLTCNAVRS